MCVIIAVPERCTVDKETLAKAWTGNPDGGGFCYVENGVVKSNKGHMKFFSFLEAYSEARASNPESPFVIHFRIRTHGACDAERTHPFMVGDDGTVALAHNGILYDMPDDPVLSDTQIFCQMYPALFNDAERLRTVRQELGKHISGSKFAVLFPNKDLVIVNESLGQWVNGCWYSNRHWNSYSLRDYDYMD
jgi:glutamine phosphoribosylpyrophosphate amidotransferase